jgi:NADH-quinone oxidoreductase subunit L
MATSAIRRFPARFAKHFEPLYKFFYNKWYFDELYNLPLRQACLLARKAVLEGGRHRHYRPLRPEWRGRCRGLQGSRIAPNAVGLSLHYALVMLLGLVAAISWAMVQAR